MIYPGENAAGAKRKRRRQNDGKKRARMKR
jgi:hypothetical protein